MQNSLTPVKKIGGAPKPPIGVYFIKVIYFLLGVIGGGSILTYLIMLIEAPEPLDESFFLGLVNVFACWAVFYGIHRLKSWVVILILAVSAASILMDFIEFSSIEPDSLSSILWKAFSILKVAFSCFSIAVFSRRETKFYFHYKGLSLIG